MLSLADGHLARALGHRDFSLLMLAQLLSSMGFWVQRIAVQWLTWKLTHSYVWLGGIALAEAAALVCVMPLAGALADRADRLQLARLARLAALAVAIVLFALALGGWLTIYGLAVLVMLTALADGIWMPVRLAMIPSLVPRRDLTAAISIGTIVFNISQFLGPALAGIIIVFSGVALAFLVNVVCSLLLLACLLAIRLGEGAPRASASSSFLADLRAGLRYALGHPAIAPLMLMGFMASLFIRSGSQLYAGYVDELFQRGAEALGLLSSAAGGGAILAGVLLAQRGRVEGLARTILLGTAACIGAQALLALAPHFSVAVAAAAMMGFFITLVSAACQVLLQNGLPETMRGRVISLWTAQLRGAPAIGAWLLGLAAGLWDIRTALLSAGFFFLCYWLYFYPRYRSMQLLEK